MAGVSEQAHDVNAAPRRIGLEASRSFAQKVASGFVAKYLSGAAILDIGYRGYSEDVEPIVPHAIGVELDYPGYDGRVLPFADMSQDAVFSSHCLEHIEDYRNALREWHRVLKIGGFMIIAVPHKFLYERRTGLPSKWNADHKRFYTPASLMSEIEDSLAPNTYRLRQLIDHDLDYDYSVSLEYHPGGCYEIELVLERIAPPAWRLEPVGGPGEGQREDGLSAEGVPPPATSVAAFLEAAPAQVPARTLEVAQPSSGRVRGIFERMRRIRNAPRLLFSNLQSIRDEIGHSFGVVRAESRATRALAQTLSAELAALRGEVVDSTARMSRSVAAVQAIVSSEAAKGAGRDEAAFTRLAAGAEADAAALRDAIGVQAARIGGLATVVAETFKLLPSWDWTPADAASVRAVLALVSPSAVAEIRKIRVGREHDGGYVMLDAFAEAKGALSLGIADDVSWDLAMAERGLDVWQFDPTISAVPVQHERFHFEALRVAAEDGDGAISLSTIASTRLDLPHDAPLILKMDVEGAEWEIFGSTDPAVLERFHQIICEFHNLHRLAEPVFRDLARTVFAKLAQSHFVFHVHGNNCGSFVNVGNVTIPQTLEISFARRGVFAEAPEGGVFPAEIDQPNQEGRADLFLGSFRF